MKICPICGSQVGDGCNFCTMCGNRIPDETQQAAYQQAPYHQMAYQAPYQQQAPVYDPYDHSAEFDPTDVSSNKPYAIIMYMMSFIGIIIALLGAKESAYVQFHVRQNLRLLIVESLLSMCAVALGFTIIVPILAAIGLIVISVIRIISFFQVCGGKSKEPAIVRGLSFLK